MTQELIANMLGVRREGVTEGALRLQKAELIRYSRGKIAVLDRPGIERRSCECYAVVKKEYDRLLPARQRPDPRIAVAVHLGEGTSPSPRTDRFMSHPNGLLGAECIFALRYRVECVNEQTLPDEARIVVT